MKLLLSVVALVACACPVLAQSGDIVVNTGGSVNCVNVKGESGFDALSYSLGGTVATNLAGGGVQTAGKPHLSDLAIVKNFDACSEALIRSFLSAKSMPTVTLIHYNRSSVSQQPPFAALTITLSNAFINSYQISGAASEHPTETVSFSYTKVCIASITQSPTGTLGTPVRVCYDLARNLVN